MLVFSAELFSAISANPYIAFHTVATESGTLVLNWEGDNGFSQTESVSLTVTASSGMASHAAQAVTVRLTLSVWLT